MGHPCGPMGEITLLKHTTAAASLNISYDGVAISEKHAQWLDNIADKAVFYMVCESAMVDASGTFEEKDVQGIKRHFAHFVEEGKTYAMSCAEFQEQKRRDGTLDDFEDPYIQS